jgi:hypothetical protein
VFYDFIREKHDEKLDKRPENIIFVLVVTFIEKAKQKSFTIERLNALLAKATARRSRV